MCSPRSTRPSASSRFSISPADARETPSISATRDASVGEPVGLRPVLADREGEEVDRLQVLVDRVSCAIGSDIVRGQSASFDGPAGGVARPAS